MAYVTIAATDYDPDSPITTTLAGAWSNNITEALAGTGGAPKVQAAALDTSIVTVNQISWGAVQTHASGTTVLPLGIYVVEYIYISGTYSGPQTQINSVWVDAVDIVPNPTSATGFVVVVSDGTNARITGTSIDYHKVL